MKDSFYTVSEDYYRLFEEKHRGSVQDIKNRLQVYIPFITALTKIDPSAAVADIGCGRGEWLEILRDHNIPAFGVDLDEGMLERGLQVGLDVKKMDCLEFLRSQADESLLAITGFHIAEHLPFEVLQAVVKESERVLKPGGLLILETPNPENISVGTCSFYMDPTHNHPLPPSLLEY
jgi:ubiquinone/menaquinone biosynthesis C-methylase UbiE